MNAFRRNAAKPIVALMLSAGLLAGITAPTYGDSIDDLTSQRDEVDDQLDQARQDVRNSENRLEQASQRLQQAERRLAGAVANLRATRGRLHVAQAEDARLRKELEASEKKLEKAEDQLAKAEENLGVSESEVAQFTVEAVLQGDSGLRAFGDLLQGEDPTIFSERMSAQAAISDAQLAHMQRLAASRVLLEVEREAVEDLRDKVADQKAAAEEQVAMMANLTAQAEAQQRSVSELVDENSAARQAADAALTEDRGIQAAFEQERNDLNDRLQALIQAELAAAQGSGGGSSGATQPNNGSTLSRPVTGRISSPYGMRRHPILGTYRIHDGTDFAARCGTSVWAAANGTVVDRYYHRAYGNRIIVNHGVMRGVSVITTYNHLSAFKVKRGQKVTRGQVIGKVGTTGWSTGCHLHFMVLKNGAHTNPMNWL